MFALVCVKEEFICLAGYVWSDKTCTQAACSYTHACTQACINTLTSDTENMLLQSVWTRCLAPFSSFSRDSSARAKALKEYSTYTHRGLMDYGSLSHRAFSAGLADWTETPCRPRGEPEGRVNTKLMERAPLWECLTSGRAQPGDDMEPSRWPNSGRPLDH